MAAVLCRNWRELTAVELWVSYQAYQIDRWHHTAHLMSCHVDNKKGLDYGKLNPYVDTKQLSNQGTRSDGSRDIRVDVRPKNIFKLK